MKWALILAVAQEFYSAVATILEYHFIAVNVVTLI